MNPHDKDQKSTEDTTKKPKKRNADKVRWFNPSPNTEDRSWLDDNEDKLVDMAFTLLEDVPEDGRFTIKYDTHSTRWLAMLFLRSVEPEYDMDALSVRGASAIDALILLSYFHTVKFDGAWVGNAAEPTGRWG